MAFKTIKYLRVLFLLLASASICFSQSKVDKVYTSLEEALLNPLAVEHLDLHNKKLKVFPTEIFKLKNLKTLNLSKNKIDVLPSEIDELVFLEKLNISRNRLYTLPINIGRLKNLRVLIANRNHIAFLPEQLSGAVKLEKIDMWKNEITSVPESIATLAELKVLDLRDNIFDRQEQNRVKLLLPKITVHFSPACACGK